MYRVAKSITGNRQDAEDAVQNVFMKLIRQGIPEEIHNNYYCGGYFCRAAINEALSIVRARNRHRLTDDDKIAAEPSNDRSPMEEDMRLRLLEAMAKLSNRDVELLVLSYQDGYTDQEIARLLNRSRGVIAVSLYRARTRLRKHLSADSGEKQ
jgi:RNA polymerase sigma-70 factor (ECF subfamily)